jgi:hypothetical protein
MVYGTLQAYRVPVAGQANSHFGGPTFPVFGHSVPVMTAAASRADG